MTCLLHLIIFAGLNVLGAGAAGEPGPVSFETASPIADIVNHIARFGVVLLILGIVLCIVRMLRGPDLADRVLASDVLSFHVVALVVVITLLLRNTAFFDAALVVAIIGFASTVAFSQYIGALTKEQREREEPS